MSEADEWKKLYYELKSVALGLEQQRDSLRSENERLRKDAERYAYLKLHYHLHVCQGFYREWRYSGRSFDAEPNPKPGEYLTLDAAIDAAKEKK